MPLPVIREETSDLEVSDSEKPPAEQPTNKAISMKLLVGIEKPSPSTTCFGFFSMIMKSLRRENRI